MDYKEILNKWATYTQYDENQKRFDMLSMNYHWHKIGEVIQMILKEYDPTGLIAVLYAKKEFESAIKNIEIPLWDLITESNDYDDEKEMFSLFRTSTLLEAEKDFFYKLNSIYALITKDKLIGEDNSINDKIFNSLEQVVESIKKCNVDLFKRGGDIEDINYISIDLHIFNTLSECLLSLEKSKDGLYFCFIRANNTAHCYFSFFVKSNGSIVSINDRVDEAYIGQLENPRNNRWTEDKADDIFPYDYIMKYAEYDYKGYATKYILQEEKINLYNIGIEGVMPIIIAMLLVISKVRYIDLNELPLRYIDSFLAVNRKKIERNELMVISESEIAEYHNNINLEFKNDKILDGTYGDEFNWNNQLTFDVLKERKATGTFTNRNQLMVDLWGQDFEIDYSKIFQKSNVDFLISKDNEENYVGEYIGSERRMRMQAYKEIREQLAEHIRDNIYNAWIEFGQTQAIIDWYHKAIEENKQFIYQLLNEHYNAKYNGCEDKIINTMGIRIESVVGKTYLDYYYIPHRDYLGVINTDKKYLDQTNHKECNVWFVFFPKNWEELEFLTNKKVPKVIKGWRSLGHDAGGNSNLHCTDAVEEVGTPVERDEIRRNRRYDNHHGAEYSFKFAWGFSKSGWNKIRKELN